MGRFTREQYDQFDTNLGALHAAAFGDPPEGPFHAHTREYIDVGEYELALEGVAWRWLETGRVCPPGLLPMFRDVAVRLRMLDNSLICYVLEGRRMLPPLAELPN